MYDNYKAEHFTFDVESEFKDQIQCFCVAACPCNGDQSTTSFNLSFFFCQWDLVVEACMCLAASCVKVLNTRVLNSCYIFQYPGRYSLGARGLKS